YNRVGDCGWRSRYHFLLKSDDPYVAQFNPGITPSASKPSEKTAAKSSNKLTKNVDEKPMHIGRLNLVVGKIIAIKKHTGADSLYIETGLAHFYKLVDIGESKPLTICSGLVNRIPMEELDQKLAIFLCNLKAAKGVASQGMILCASDPQRCECLVPPNGAKAGDRVTCPGYICEPDIVLNTKDKVWETVKPDLKVNDLGVAVYRGTPLIIESLGEITTLSVKNCNIG
ncbi:hypothetical protein MXB_1540, partial [Myxobolus squamalis]